MDKPGHNDSDAITRRQALLRLGGTAAGVALLATTPGVLNGPTAHETSIRRLPRGTLILMGGNVEPGHKMFDHAEALGITPEQLKGYTLTPEQVQLLAQQCDFSGIFADMQKHCPIKGKTVVCVTSASANAESNANLNKILFRLFGAADVVCISSRAQAELPGVVAKIKDPRTSLVYFDGGKQEVLAKNFMGTRACEAMRQRYIVDPSFAVAGSSAGAAVMSGNGAMIEGWNTDDTYAVMGSGLGLLDHVIVDTHLHRSASLPRLPRLQKAVESRKDCVGLGLDEGTGVVIKDGDATVIGRQKVWKIAPEDCKRSFAEITMSGFSKGESIPLGNHACIRVQREPEMGRN